MHRRPPAKETIGRGDLIFFSCPSAEDVFSRYGLTIQPGNEELLTGLLMIDRLHPAAPDWFAEAETALAECDIVTMTPVGAAPDLTRSLPGPCHVARSDSPRPGKASAPSLLARMRAIL